MKTEYEFTEIFKLKEMLEKNNIKHVFRDDTMKFGEKIYTDYHIWLYEDEKEKDDFLISVIQSFGSYGREKDLLEIMGLLTEEESQYDGVVGYLTAENVFERIKKYLSKEVI